MNILSLKIFSWNCKGLSNVHTVNRVKDVMARLKPNLVCLVETKASPERVYRFCSKIMHKWEWVAISSLGLSGGILVLWRKKVGDVTLVVNSRLALHLVITTKDQSWVLTTVYNSQVISDHKRLWNSLNVFNTLQSPWLLTGDFNAITNQDEHKGGSFHHYYSKSRSFNKFITDNSLFDLGYIGSPYTWCNCHEGLARRWACLDCYLANPLWLMSFKNYSNQHLARTNSDHSPLFLKAHNFVTNSIKVFRFDNFWLDYEGCHDSILRAWSCHNNNDPLHFFSHAVTRTKRNLLKWRSMSLSHLDKELQKIKAEISSVEEQLTPVDNAWRRT